jgi:hypothetical protein
MKINLKNVGVEKIKMKEKIYLKKENKYYNCMNNKKEV